MELYSDDLWRASRRRPIRYFVLTKRKVAWRVLLVVRWEIKKSLQIVLPSMSALRDCAELVYSFDVDPRWRSRDAPH